MNSALQIFHQCNLGNSCHKHHILKTLIQYFILANTSQNVFEGRHLNYGKVNVLCCLHQRTFENSNIFKGVTQQHTKPKPQGYFKRYMCHIFLSIQNCFMTSRLDIIYLCILCVACVCVQVQICIVLVCLCMCVHRHTLMFNIVSISLGTIHLAVSDSIFF